MVPYPCPVCERELYLLEPVACTSINELIQKIKRSARMKYLNLTLKTIDLIQYHKDSNYPFDIKRKV